MRKLRGQLKQQKGKAKLSWMRCYLDWQPAINVFEIERSLIFAECESVIDLKALQFFLVAYDEYLNKR